MVTGGEQDRKITEQLVKRALAAGYTALAVTVDTPVLGRREADMRNRFKLPEHLTMGNFVSAGGAHASGTKDGGNDSVRFFFVRFFSFLTESLYFFLSKALLFFEESLVFFFQKALLFLRITFFFLKQALFLCSLKTQYNCLGPPDTAVEAFFFFPRHDISISIHR